MELIVKSFSLLNLKDMKYIFLAILTLIFYKMEITFEIEKEWLSVKQQYIL